MLFGFKILVLYMYIINYMVYIITKNNNAFSKNLMTLSITLYVYPLPPPLHLIYQVLF